MANFRLPRKIKKILRKSLWLYPADKKGNSLMASPCSIQEDYTALKQGVVRALARTSRKKRKEFRAILNKEIFVSNEELKVYVDDILAEEFRISSYNILLEAKKNKKAVVAYFNFVNAYKFYQQGKSSYGNICCMSIDYAKDLLKTKRK